MGETQPLNHSMFPKTKPARCNHPPPERPPKVRLQRGQLNPIDASLDLALQTQRTVHQCLKEVVERKSFITLVALNKV
jgi:hypothetical protein